MELSAPATLSAHPPNNSHNDKVNVDQFYSVTQASNLPAIAIASSAGTLELSLLTGDVESHGSDLMHVSNGGASLVYSPAKSWSPHCHNGIVEASIKGNTHQTGSVTSANGDDDKDGDGTKVRKFSSSPISHTITGLNNSLKSGSSSDMEIRDDNWQMNNQYVNQQISRAGLDIGDEKEGNEADLSSIRSMQRIWRMDMNLESGKESKLLDPMSAYMNHHHPIAEKERFRSGFINGTATERTDHDLGAQQLWRAADRPELARANMEISEVNSTVMNGGGLRANAISYTYMMAAPNGDDDDNQEEQAMDNLSNSIYIKPDPSYSQSYNQAQTGIVHLDNYMTSLEMAERQKSEDKSSPSTAATDLSMAPIAAAQSMIRENMMSNMQTNAATSGLAEQSMSRKETIGSDRVGEEVMMMMQMMEEEAVEEEEEEIKDAEIDEDLERALFGYSSVASGGYGDIGSSGTSAGRGSSAVAAYLACDEFRMYEFKIRGCMREKSHDWTQCPFAHPGEKARRRDPRLHTYAATPCPDFRKSSCKRGDDCELSHGVFECWLHPSRYRTQLCKDGKQCKRKVCFFAHSPSQLRMMNILQNICNNSGSTASAVSSSSSSSSTSSSSSSASGQLGADHCSKNSCIHGCSKAPASLKRQLENIPTFYDNKAYYNSCSIHVATAAHPSHRLDQRSSSPSDLLYDGSPVRIAIDSSEFIEGLPTYYHQMFLNKYTDRSPLRPAYPNTASSHQVDGHIRYSAANSCNPTSTSISKSDHRPALSSTRMNLTRPTTLGFQCIAESAVADSQPPSNSCQFPTRDQLLPNYTKEDLFPFNHLSTDSRVSYNKIKQASNASGLSSRPSSCFTTTAKTPSPHEQLMVMNNTSYNGLRNHQMDIIANRSTPTDILHHHHHHHSHPNTAPNAISAGNINTHANYGAIGRHAMNILPAVSNRSSTISSSSGHGRSSSNNPNPAYNYYGHDQYMKYILQNNPAGIGQENHLLHDLNAAGDIPFYQVPIHHHPSIVKSASSDLKYPNNNNNNINPCNVIGSDHLPQYNSSFLSWPDIMDHSHAQSSYGINVMDQIKQNSAFIQPRNYNNAVVNPVITGPSQYNILQHQVPAMEANIAHQKITSTSTDQTSSIITRHVDHTVDELGQREYNKSESFGENNNSKESSSQLLSHLEASLHEMELRTMDYMEAQKMSRSKKLAAIAASKSSDVTHYQVADHQCLLDLQYKDDGKTANMVKNTVDPWIRPAGSLSSISTIDHLNLVMTAHDQHALAGGNHLNIMNHMNGSEPTMNHHNHGAYVDYHQQQQHQIQCNKQQTSSTGAGSDNQIWSSKDQKHLQSMMINNTLISHDWVNELVK